MARYLPSEMAHALFYLGGLTGAGLQLEKGNWGQAIGISLIAVLCILLLSGGMILAQVLSATARSYLEKQQNSDPNKREEK